ncbi:alpha/beta fold hydrolase [Amycolatopsis sp. CA-230715]|uniref:alpha/beta fold hydrolase n=1 Tax=Amycolatopsis sp. CA-230715 TaxID=2745196 RepID=UPI001C323CBA|nr:alpha/beta hydrolase [Amycolatopsis sp. CA-230715]QWF81195.1 hypothetical protein HUW46_04621 [Amycolatopsis sp. CA-230715]
MIGELITAGGESVHIRQDGVRGNPVILLLHGFSGSVHWFDRLTPLLAERFHVVRLDLRGHGHTGGHTGLDARSQARTVAAALDAIDVTEVVAAGHSFGADVAIALAEESRHVRKIVVIGQAPDYSFATFPPGNGLLALPVLGALAHRLATPSAVRLGVRFGFARGFAFNRAFDRPDQAVLDHAAMSPAMARTVIVERRRLLAARPLDEQVRAIGLPTAAILGRRDRFYDCEKTAARWAAVGAKVDVIEDSGHSPILERPARVAELLQDFVAG